MRELVDALRAAVVDSGVDVGPVRVVSVSPEARGKKLDDVLAGAPSGAGGARSGAGACAGAPRAGTGMGTGCALRFRFNNRPKMPVIRNDNTPRLFNLISTPPCGRLLIATASKIGEQAGVLNPNLFTPSRADRRANTLCEW